MNALLIAGDAAPGLSVMKFTVTYDGELRSNGSPRQKWDIRWHLSPQLEELWKVDATLRNVERRRLIPSSHGYFHLEGHHSRDHERVETLPPPPGPDVIDLCQPIERGGWKFIPLIRDSLALKCGLKIQFLRKEDSGRVYQGGDLDNRIKTLFDGLAVPNIDQCACPGANPDGSSVYCLLEDDSLISGCSIETGRLLTRPGANLHEVRLVIEVDVRIAQARPYNQLFLGD